MIRQPATPVIVSFVDPVGWMLQQPAGFHAVVDLRMNVRTESSALHTQVVSQISSSVENLMRIQLSHVCREPPLRAPVGVQDSAQMVHIAMPLFRHVKMLLTTSALGPSGILEDLPDQMLLKRMCQIGHLDSGKRDRCHHLQ